MAPPIGVEAFAVALSASLRAFGRNHAAQLGKAHRFAVVRPKRVGKNRWLDIAAGTTATLAVREDSSLRIWGGWTKVPHPKDLAGVQGLSRLVTVGKWRSVAMGTDHGLALRADGALFALGADEVGQTGCGERPTYIQVCRVQGGPWLAMAAGRRFSVGLRADGSFLVWGNLAFADGPPAPGHSALALHPTSVDRRLAFPPFQPAIVGEGPRSLALEGFRGDSLMLRSANPEVAAFVGESLRVLTPGTTDIEVWALPRPGWNRQGNTLDTLRAMRTLEVAALPLPAVAAVSPLPLPSPVEPPPAAKPRRESRTWVPSRQALLWAGGGALIAGGTLWAWLTYFGAEKSQPPELGLPPGDPVLQGALP